jgi:hypothetical protein
MVYAVNAYHATHCILTVPTVGYATAVHQKFFPTAAAAGCKHAAAAAAATLPAKWTMLSAYAADAVLH